MDHQGRSPTYSLLCTSKIKGRDGRLILVVRIFMRVLVHAVNISFVRSLLFFISVDFQGREIDSCLASVGRTEHLRQTDSQGRWTGRKGRTGEINSFKGTLIYGWVDRADLEDGSTMVLPSDIHSSRETGIMWKVGLSLMTKEACATIDVSQ